MAVEANTINELIDVPHTFGTKVLRISHSDVDATIITKIRDIFKVHPNLRSFHLNSSRFTTTENAIDFWNTARTSPLVSIYLTSVPLAKEATLCLATSIQEMRLNILELRGTGVSDSLVVQLAHAFEHCFSLSHVSLGYNRIGAEGCITLANSLANTSITTLDMSWNPIGALGVAHLAAPGCRITVLKLDYTEMGQDGFVALCDALVDNQINLMQLNVDGNNITDMQCVCRVVARNTGLKILNLSNNNLEDCLEFNEAAFRCLTLERISFSANSRLTDAFANDMFDVLLCTHSCINNVCFSYTGITIPTRNKVNKRLAMLNSKRTKALLALCTGKFPQWNTFSSFCQQIPMDLIRMVGNFL